MFDAQSPVFLAFAHRLGLGPVRAVFLTGDASSRQYVRLFSETEPSRSYVLMVMDPRSPLKSEEAGWDHVQPDELLFINMQRFLHRIGARVPEIYGYDPEAGLLLLEDLGDLTLEGWLTHASAWGADHSAAVTSTEAEPLPELVGTHRPAILRLPSEVEGIYRKAIDSLVHLQAHAIDGDAFDQTWASRVYFDEALLYWEFHHFYEYTVAPSPHPGLPGDDALILEALRVLARVLAQQPTTCVHRDLHCRNLMIHREQVYLIDFQDAVTGPLLYDLVSLLGDAYIKLPERMVGRLKDYYYERASVAGVRGLPARDVMERDYLAIGLHRLMKAAGRFDFLNTVKHKPSYLQYIPHLLDAIRTILRRDPAYGELHAALARRLPVLA
ncbi:MAG: aminoglycoside phosphotransferase family protein [Myxococcota bacterium]